MTVSQMTVDDLRLLIADVVEEKLAKFYEHEDDLELTDELKELLARQTEEVKNGERGEPMESVLTRLGLS